jgi:hypothetical protein
MKDFIQSLTKFSWALTVFGFSQAGNILRGLPTSDPTLKATESFNITTETIEEQYDSIDKTVFDIGNTVQTAVIETAFNLLKPANYAPRTVWETTQNLARWGLGLATQFIPGGKVGTGGPPTGWGPVNIDDAELFYVRGGVSAAEVEAGSTQSKQQGGN